MTLNSAPLRAPPLLASTLSNSAEMQALS